MYVHLEVDCTPSGIRLEVLNTITEPVISVICNPVYTGRGYLQNIPLSQANMNSDLQTSVALHCYLLHARGIDFDEYTTHKRAIHKLRQEYTFLNMNNK